MPVQKSPVIILKSKEVEAWVESDLKCKKTKKNHCLIDFPEQTKKDFILREKHRILSDDYSSILERKHQEEKNERWALSRSCHLLPTSEREGKGLFDPKM